MILCRGDRCQESGARTARRFTSFRSHCACETRLYCFIVKPFYQRSWDGEQEGGGGGADELNGEMCAETLSRASASWLPCCPPVVVTESQCSVKPPPATCPPECLFPAQGCRRTSTLFCCSIRLHMQRGNVQHDAISASIHPSLFVKMCFCIHAQFVDNAASPPA